MVHSAPLYFVSTYICILKLNNHIQQGPLRPTLILFHEFSLLSELCIFELFPIRSCMVHSAPFLSHVLTLIPLHFNIHIQQGPLRPTVILFHVFLLLCELCIFKLLPIRTCMVHSAPISFSSTYICILNSNNHIQQGPLRPILFHRAKFLYIKVTYF